MVCELCTQKRLFFTKYFRFQSQSLFTCNNAGNNFARDQYCVSKTILLMCGDVELNVNPGSSTYEKKCVVRPSAIRILELRLHQF